MHFRVIQLNGKETKDYLYLNSWR